MLIIDTECYNNFWLLVVLNQETGEFHVFKKTPNENLDKKAIFSLLKNATSIGFNSLNYDLPMIKSAHSGMDNAALFKFSNAIIRGETIYRETPKIDHIDIIDVLPGRASLKMYGARIHTRTIQELPYPVDTKLSPAEMDAVIQYCKNDVLVTSELFNLVSKQIELRAEISKRYGVDLRSKSDAQIAEAVFKKELNNISAVGIKDEPIKYKAPAFIQFKTAKLKNLVSAIESSDFELSPAGSVALPKAIAGQSIVIGNSAYSLGIGGLHSKESNRGIVCDSDSILIDFDVASYYPSIIINGQINPTKSSDFIKKFQGFVKERLEAKARGDKVTAESLKITVNGTFGKMKSKYSVFYCPDCFLAVTITGQLALLQLIESLELAGISVVSANTDGIVIHTKKENLEKLNKIVADWEKQTGLKMESTEYAALYNRDVNNYLAIKSGSVKKKGVFADPGLVKNPDGQIIYKAVIDYLAHGKPLEETIKECADIRQFVSCRKVEGGAIYNGIPLGETVRYYHSSKVPAHQSLTYALNSRTVPNSNGCKPLQVLPDKLPPDIDYRWYINQAKELAEQVGGKVQFSLTGG